MSTIEKIAASMGSLIFLYLVAQHSASANNFINAIGGAVTQQVQTLQGR